MVGQKKFVRLADESLRQVNIAPEQRYALGIDIREYERMGNLDGKHFEDVYVVDPLTGDRKLAIKHAEHVMGESPDGTRFLYYRDGVFYSLRHDRRQIDRPGLRRSRRPSSIVTTT